MEENRLQDKECFVILGTGDTVFGNEINVNQFDNTNGFNRYSWVKSVKLDKKKYDGDEIVAFQTKNVFAVLDGKKIPNGRIATGKINVYMYQTFKTSYDATYRTNTKGFPTTYFVFQKGNKLPAELIPITYESLREAVSDNPAALKTYDRLYPKAPKANNDYEKILEVVAVYNKK